MKAAVGFTVDVKAGSVGHGGLVRKADSTYMVPCVPDDVFFAVSGTLCCYSSYFSGGGPLGIPKVSEEEQITSACGNNVSSNCAGEDW